MKISHVFIAALVIAVVVLVKIAFFPRDLFGGDGGATRVVVRIDPRAAAQVRAWRRAHGLDPAPPASSSPGGRVARIDGDLSDFVSSCTRSGHLAALHRHHGELVATCQ